MVHNEGTNAQVLAVGRDDLVPALVLAAGLGTRLRPLTEHIPKPAVPVLGRPLMGWALTQLYAAGCTDVWANAFHLADRLQHSVEPWVQRRLLRLRLGWSIEGPDILGTGGALRRLESRLCANGGPFLLLNGDSILGVDLRALLDAHRRNRAEGAIATLLCVRHPEAARYGEVKVDADGRILDLNRHAVRPGTTDAARDAAISTVFAGVHVIEPEALRTLPPDGVESCIVRQGYAPRIAGGDDVRAYVVDASTPFFDVGSADRYLDAQAALLRPLAERPVLSVAPGVDPLEAHFQEASYAVDAAGRTYGTPDAVEGIASAVLEPPFFFGPRNRVEAGARIGPDVSIGAMNTIGAGAVLRDCSLWSGVEIPAGGRCEGRIASRWGRSVVEAARAN